MSGSKRTVKLFGGPVTDEETSFRDAAGLASPRMTHRLFGFIHILYTRTRTFTWCERWAGGGEMYSGINTNRTSGQPQIRSTWGDRFRANIEPCRAEKIDWKRLLGNDLAKLERKLARFQDVKPSRRIDWQSREILRTWTSKYS